MLYHISQKGKASRTFDSFDSAYRFAYRTKAKWIRVSECLEFSKKVSFKKIKSFCKAKSLHKHILLKKEYALCGFNTEYFHFLSGDIKKDPLLPVYYTVHTLDKALFFIQAEQDCCGYVGVDHILMCGVSVSKKSKLKSNYFKQYHFVDSNVILDLYKMIS